MRIIRIIAQSRCAQLLSACHLMHVWLCRKWGNSMPGVKLRRAYVSPHQVRRFCDKIRRAQRSLFIS